MSEFGDGASAARADGEERGGKRRLRAVAEQRHPLYLEAAGKAGGALIFLDFDGVLHPLGEGASSFSQAPLLMAAIEALEAQGRGQVSIALTTSWRFQPMDRIKAELSAAAAGLGERVEGRSGSLSGEAIDGGGRLAECLEYLAGRPGGAPGWMCALDDQSAIFEQPALDSAERARRGPPMWLIVCDSRIGIDRRKALEIEEAGKMAARGSWPPEAVKGGRGEKLGWEPVQRSRL